MFVPRKNDFIGFNPYHVITKPSSAWKPPAATTQLDLTMPAGKFENEAILQDLLEIWKLKAEKRSFSGRLPLEIEMDAHSSKTKKICKTSEVDNIKKEAIQRDFLQKWKVECRADCLITTRFVFFSRSIRVKYCTCHEKIRPGHTKCCTCPAKSS